MSDDAQSLDCNEPTRGSVRVVTTPRQALTGLHIGLANLRVPCSTCDRALQAGDSIWVYAHRTADEPEWQLTRCYCEGCAAHAPVTQTLGASETFVKARLDIVTLASEDRRQLCLSNVEICKYIPPSDSDSP